MIQRVEFRGISSQPRISPRNNAQAQNFQVNTNPIKYDYSKLAGAYQGIYGIKTANTVSFGKSLSAAFNELQSDIYTCRDKLNKGECVGWNVPVSKFIDQISVDLPSVYDAIKTNIVIDEKDGTIKDARTQLKKMPQGILYEMAVRPTRTSGTLPDKYKIEELPQIIRIEQDPNSPEKAYVLNTKGNLMTVLEDNDDVLMTNYGEITKLPDNNQSHVKITAIQNNDEYFKKFVPNPQPVIEKKWLPSQGEGTEIVIGMEDGRFVNEVIDSIITFIDKINRGEIVLDQFKAKEGAKNTQLAMLAGGFGSRAEYTNASSSGIFHGKKDGAQSTKGVFRTATGLTPMETTFITLHNAGLLDCSPEKIGIGKNIKLYLNKSGINKGNGGFTVDLYNKMDREGRKSLCIFPNDSMSRMTNATIKMNELMDTGKVAIAMIAKEVSANNAAKKLGIMKLNEDNEILEFAEKPKMDDIIKYGFENKGKCLANTFQFAVSKEAFKALSIIEEYLPTGANKESRDWSKVYVPIVMGLSKFDKYDDIINYLKANVKDVEINIPEKAIFEAKNALKGQKVYAVTTSEPWADCGNLDSLYYTTMQIANGDFKLEDFECKHVLDCINYDTGLITSSPEQKERIESKYDIKGKVMVVPQAKKVNSNLANEYTANGLITVNK